MDTTDPDIDFDHYGVCCHCRDYDQKIKRYIFPEEEGRRRLVKIIDHIKKEGRQKEYDCIVGVSGGVDSAYVILKAKELGLRPLAVHLDNGWDSELAANNIHNLLKALNIDLYTHVINWDEFRDLQLSFLKASTPDAEIPSDHAIVSLLYNMTEERRLRYIITGYNIRTESHHPKAWSQGHMDWKYIQSIHRQFGRMRLTTFPHMDFWDYSRYFLTKKNIFILNYLDYVKKDAMKLLERQYGWRYYGGKHYESIYTRFYQGYFLPNKFGYDKRKAHLSSLICSGEITREQALEELEKETYPMELQREDRAYVIKKLNLTDEEFDKIMNLPQKTYWNYPSYGWFYKSLIYKGLRTIYHRLI